MTKKNDGKKNDRKKEERQKEWKKGWIDRRKYMKKNDKRKKYSVLLICYN